MGTIEGHDKILSAIGWYKITDCFNPTLRFWDSQILALTNGTLLLEYADTKNINMQTS